MMTTITHSYNVWIRKSRPSLDGVPQVVQDYITELENQLDEGHARQSRPRPVRKPDQTQLPPEIRDYITQM
jgi:hypothetical protein